MNLSLDRRADGDATGAQELREQVLAQYPQVLGPEHPESRLATNYGRVTIDIEPMMY
jgi:hypothetical protein